MLKLKNACERRIYSYLLSPADIFGVIIQILIHGHPNSFTNSLIQQESGKYLQPHLFPLTKVIKLLELIPNIFKMKGKPETSDTISNSWRTVYSSFRLSRCTNQLDLEKR